MNKIDQKEAALILDDGFWFGIGAFETILTRANVPIFPEEHLQRLWSAMRVLNIKSEDEKESFLQQCRSKMRAFLDTHVLENHALKLTVTEKNIVLTQRQNPYTADMYTKGFTLALSPVRNNESSPMTYIKAMNCADHIMEKRRMKALGIDEPLLLNSKGEVCEGATTNIFLVKEGKIYTPSVECGLLRGIMREYVCKNYEVIETVIRPEDLTDFEECFVTNSLMGIMPVVRCEDRVFEKHMTARKIMDAYEREQM